MPITDNKNYSFSFNMMNIKKIDPSPYQHRKYFVGGCDGQQSIIFRQLRLGLSCGGGSNPGQVIMPFDLSVGPSGKVYVADTENHRVQVFNNGEVIPSAGTSKAIIVAGGGPYKKRYQHRLCLDGTPLNYFAMVGKKQKNISNEILEQY